MNSIYVKKASGEMQLFSLDKLKRSLEFTGAKQEDIQTILEEIRHSVYDGISTQSIYKLAFKRLRKISRPLSAFYGTKKALMELGPDGYLFEKYIARVFSHLGYTTQVGVNLEGKCISHEVDVVAESAEKTVLMECKFHNSKDKKNDIKSALYIKARADDLMANKKGLKFDEFWFVSNTHFSDDAIQYSTCAGLHLLGANFPPHNTIQDIVRDHDLHPITCLSSLKKMEKTMLLESDILLATEIMKNPSLLRDIGLSENRAYRVRAEIQKICQRKKY